LRLGDVDFVALVMFHCWVGVPTGVAIRIPRFSFVGFIMAYYLGPRWREWGPVKVKSSMDLCVGGEFWVESQAGSRFRVRSVPKIERGIWVRCA
jgi:hypothetical protein